MDYKKQFNQVVKFSPTYVNTLDDVRNGADVLYGLKKLSEAIAEEYKKECDKIEALKQEIDKKYKTIIDAIAQKEGELRGKIQHYAENVIKSGELLEKRIEAKNCTLTFVADKKVEVKDLQALINGVANAKYPTTLLQPKLNEIKKYVKATRETVDGCEVEDTVYFMIR